jgi:hypothetical protein
MRMVSDIAKTINGVNVEFKFIKKLIIEDTQNQHALPKQTYFGVWNFKIFSQREHVENCVDSIQQVVVFLLYHVQKMGGDCAVRSENFAQHGGKVGELLTLVHNLCSEKLGGNVRGC